MVEGALLSAKCSLNVSLYYFLENFETESGWVSLCQWHQRKDSCIKEKFGLDNPYGSFQLGEFTNCFSSSLLVKVCDHIKGVNKRRIFFFFDRVNVMELYSVKKLNQAISGEG